MSERLAIPLFEPVQAHKAFTHAFQHVKPWLMAGHRLLLRIEPETRRDNHNRHFHSLISQISKQLGGDLADAEDAKRILISAFRIDTRIPDDPVLVGRMLPLTFDLDMALPRVNPQDLKTGMVVPVKDSWTVQVQVMPHGYTRLYRRIGRIALIVAGVAMVLGFLRILLPGRTG